MTISPLDGTNVIAAGGWFAARPSGTGAVIYAENSKSEEHLDTIVCDAQAIVTEALTADVVEQPHAG